MSLGIQIKMSCLICQKSDNLVFLRDGSAVHKECIEYDEKPQILNLRRNIEVETSRLSRIKPNFTFWESIFGSRAKEEKAEIDRLACRKEIDRLESLINKLNIRTETYQEAYGDIIQDSIRYWPGIPPLSIWHKIKDTQSQSQKHLCYFCRSKISLAGGHLFHIEALALGGLNEEENIKLVCNSCHRDQHAERAQNIKLEQALAEPNWKLFSHFEILNFAKEYNQSALVEYVDENGEVTNRWISVIDFKYEIQRGDRIWIRAHCFLRNDERSFRLDRFNAIKQLSVKKIKV